MLNMMDELKSNLINEMKQIRLEQNVFVDQWKQLKTEDEQPEKQKKTRKEELTRIRQNMKLIKKNVEIFFSGITIHNSKKPRTFFPESGFQ